MKGLQKAMWKSEAESWAREWVRTDLPAARRDVHRLGPEGAALYWLELAADQPEWAGRLDFEAAVEVARELAGQE